MHPVSIMMNSLRHRTWAGGGPKSPPSAPPAIPPIIINPFNREAPRQPNIDPLRTPPAPPILPPRLPGFRLRDGAVSRSADLPHSLA